MESNKESWKTDLHFFIENTDYEGGEYFVKQLLAKAMHEGISQGRGESRLIARNVPDDKFEYAVKYHELRSAVVRQEELTRVKGIIEEMKSQKKYDKEKDSIARGFEIDGWNLALRTLESKLGENSKGEL